MDSHVSLRNQQHLELGGSCKPRFHVRSIPFMTSLSLQPLTSPLTISLLSRRSTHPANGKRIKAIESWLPEVRYLPLPVSCRKKLFADISFLWGPFFLLDEPQALNIRAASPTCGDMAGHYENFREETHLPRRVAPQQVLLGGERMGRW